MEMFDPPHAGKMIREDCLKPLDLSVTAAAKWLGISRVTLSELLNGHNGITADMAIRLERRVGARPSRGCVINCPMICGKPNGARARSRLKNIRRVRLHKHASHLNA